MLAVAFGYVEPVEDVIAVGGTSRRADTAIVVRATFPNHALGQDDDKSGSRSASSCASLGRREFVAGGVPVDLWLAHPHAPGLVA